MTKALTEKTAATGEPVSKKVLWLVLLVAWLGWMFDGMEMGLYSVLAHPALKELLNTADKAIIGKYAGYMFALFLLGASAGGFIFGRLGDKIGRVKTMILTVLMYSVFTGLTYFTRNAWQFGACRFIGAMGLGGEWGLGVALVMETWPNAKRPVLAGLLGSSANVGFLISALINWKFGDMGWRHIILIGLIPALLTLIIRMAIKEPEKWVKARERGERPDMRQLFEPQLRKNMILACLISSVAVVGTWGVFQLIPTWVNTMVGGAAVRERAVAAMWMAFGQIAGSFVGGPAAEWLGRRKSYALFCVLSLASALLVFQTTHGYNLQLLILAAVAGVFTTSFFGWLPLYLPELFPTRIRSTGEGISFNIGRIVAALAIIMGFGQLDKVFGGSFERAGSTMSFVYVIGLILIWFLPETKGCKLPD